MTMTSMDELCYWVDLIATSTIVLVVVLAGFRMFRRAPSTGARIATILMAIAAIVILVSLMRQLLLWLVQQLPLIILAVLAIPLLLRHH